MAARIHLLRRVSFRTRLSLLAAAAAGVAVALAAIASYFAVEHQLSSETNSNLSNEVAGAFRTDPTTGNRGLFIGGLARAGRGGDSVQLITATGQVVFSSSPGTTVIPISVGDTALAQPSDAGVTRLRSASFANQHLRILTQGLGPTNFDGTTFPGLALQVAHNLSLVDNTLRDLRAILLILALVGIAVALGLGWAAARAMIRPVERLTAAAEHVAATQDLDATIDEQGDDELARLAHSFNAMLVALGGSRRQQAQLVADAGHELRTPLTSLRTNVEVLMRMHDLPPADREALLGDVEAQLGELTTLVGDLVELAREDEQEPAPIDVAFDQVISRALERARRRNGSLTFDVHTEPGMVRAQPALLERAVLNVLDNAAKWSPPGGRVEVDLRRGERWSLLIRDHGPGISAEDLPRIFDRFFRAPSARSMPGSGLGLAIVRQVVEAHGGQVSVAGPPDGGTAVHIDLPIVAEDAAPSWPEGDHPPLSTVPAWPDQ